MRSRGPLVGPLLSALLLAGCGGGSSTSSTAARTTPVGTPAPAPVGTGTVTATSPAKSAAPRAAPPPARSPGTGPVVAHSATPARFKHALAAFAACLRTNGVNLPPAAGHLFSLKGVDTRSPAYLSAAAKCRPVLIAAFKSLARARPATAGVPPRGPLADSSSASPRAKRLRAQPPRALETESSITAVPYRANARPYLTAFISPSDRHGTLPGFISIALN
jgi:hypothetical protein